MSITSVLNFKNDTTTKLIDARGPRFGAIITTAVLTSYLATEFLPILLIQLVVFGLGAFVGPHASPYGFFYSKVIKPRLKGDVPTEDVRPPQFAQLVGFTFALLGAIAEIAGFAGAGAIIIGFALAAAFLNAAFNFCLGCEMYLLIARLRYALSRRKNYEDSYNLPSL